MREVAPKAELLYTHPVKAQSDIRLALEDYRIRTLVLDHEDEVAKILRIVRGLDLARDIWIARAAGRAGSSAAQAFLSFAGDKLKR